MKKMILLGLGCAIAMANSFANEWTIAPHVDRALIYGADTKATFHVIDDKGNPVEGATVGAGFYLNKEYGKNPSCRGLTNQEGFFTARGKGVGTIKYSASKRGYYKTRGKIDFRGGEDWTWASCVKDGKWQPYGKTYKVVLKPIKKPIPMYIAPARNDQYLPLKNTPIGFDMLCNDWVQPYGKGETVDFMLTYVPLVKTKSIDQRRKLIIKFVRPFDGAYVMKKDLFSAYHSVYRANPNATYTQSFTLFRPFVKKKEPVLAVADDEYLVLRTRSTVDDKGQLKTAHYSKIYGEIDFALSRDETKGGVGIQSYFNPNPNDTNLEAIQEWAYETKAANPEIYKRITQGGKRAQ